jgi:tetraacyldisaccharide 4'-kinase
MDISLWIEKYLFYPNIFQRFISILLLPLTLIYCLIVTFRRFNNTSIDFKIPIISVGNLIVGGSGKTPMIIHLAHKYQHIAVILRGYGRKSKGLIIVQKNDDVLRVGDEALEYKLKLPQAIVIVSEDRIKGILKAKQLGAKIIFLDDGFRFYNIKKFDILLRPKDEPTNELCLPSGGYKEPKMNYSFADMVLTEGIDFKRKVSFISNGVKLQNLPQKFVLVSAISKANRLLEYIPQPTYIFFYKDHYFFTIQDVSKFTSLKLPIVTTYKDYVKLQKFNIQDIILLDLEIETSISLPINGE